MTETAKTFFDKNKYVLLTNFLSKETSHLLYEHTKLSATKFSVINENLNLYPDYKKLIENEVFGTFTDGHVNEAFSYYGDTIMDTILKVNLNRITNTIGIDLLPTYTYYRIYFNGNELEKHIDRESCEISGILCLGYDVSNVDSKVYPNYSWPMYIKTIDGKELPVKMNPGDLLIYRGCDIEHWREPFPGINHSQLFLHTANVNNNLLLNDSRPSLGLPAEFSLRDPTHPLNIKLKK